MWVKITTSFVIYEFSAWFFYVQQTEHWLFSSVYFCIWAQAASKVHLETTMAHTFNLLLLEVRLTNFLEAGAFKFY